MSGFEQLEGAIDPSSMQPPTADEVAWRGEQMSDETALSMVVADAQTAEAFIQSKNMAIDWERADNNFRAFGMPKNWSGTESQRAGLTMPLVMEVVEKLVALLFLAFFSDPQPFLLDPIGPVPPAAVRAQEKLLVWATQLSGFKEEIRECLKSAVLYGFCVAKWGWKTAKKTSKTYNLATDGTGKVKKAVKDYEISHPTFENVSLRKALFDPSLPVQDPRKGRFSIFQIFTDAQRLDDLRNDKTYQNVPTRQQLAEILARGDESATDSLAGAKNMSYRDLQAAPEKDKQSQDPLKAPLEILEWVSEDRVITVLQRKIVIRNDVQEFGRTNVLGCAFIDVPGSMYGFGVSKLLGGEQYLQTSVINSWLDVTALRQNPAFTSEQGLQTTSQQIKVAPGRILTGPKLTPIPIPDVSAEALNVLQTSEARATRRVGANSADNMPTQALRTASGVSAFTEGATDKLQYFIEIFSEMVFIPGLEAFLDVMKDNLQPDDIKRILVEQDGKAYEGANILDVYNSRCTVRVLSSTKLNQRRAAAQLVPLFLQLASAQPVQEALAAQGMKFDFAELIEEAVELGGWDIDALIVPASPQDLQRAMQIANPQAGVAQAQAAQQDKQHQNDLENIEATGLMRAGVNLISHAAKSSAAESEGALI